MRSVRPICPECGSAIPDSRTLSLDSADGGSRADWAILSCQNCLAIVTAPSRGDRPAVLTCRGQVVRGVVDAVTGPGSIEGLSVALRAVEPRKVRVLVSAIPELVQALRLQHGQALALRVDAFILLERANETGLEVSLHDPWLFPWKDREPVGFRRLPLEQGGGILLPSDEKAAPDEERTDIAVLERKTVVHVTEVESRTILVQLPRCDEVANWSALTRVSADLELFVLDD